MLQRKQPDYINHDTQLRKAPVSDVTANQPRVKGQSPNHTSGLICMLSHLEKHEDQMKVCFQDINRRKGLCDAGRDGNANLSGPE